MGEYDRYAYEDLDEYEEDGLDDGEGGYGEDEYEEEEEEPKPTKEVLDYLELRQKLKEQKRKELRKEIGAVNGNSHEKKNLISRDSFGSFFGPSQPVIAQRVIQESKSLFETASSATRINKSSQSNNKSSGSSLFRKPQSSGQKPRVPNLQHKKVEILKNTRDYSFLLSDDAEVPVPKTAPPPRNISAVKPEMRSAPQPERSKGSVSSSGRKDFRIREDRKSSTAIDRNRMQPRLGTDRLSSGANQVRQSIDSRKHIAATNGALVDRKKLLSSSNGSGPGRPTLSKNAPSSSINGSSGRPVLTKTAPPKVQVGASDRKNVPVSRSSAPSVQRPATSKPLPSVSRQTLSRKEEHPMRERVKGRDEYQVREKPKVIPKHSVPAPKPKQVLQPPPKNVSRETSRDERPRKRPLRHHEDDNDDDPQKALSMIRSMFRYNPRKYDNDTDDSDMEAGFDDIMREERRSAKIARREDEEELRKIEEEERRERLRKEAKKRKLSNG